MLALPTISDFLSQIRHRVRARETVFRRKVDGFYSKAGVDGLVGALVHDVAEALLTDFDDTISELLDYLEKANRRTSLTRQDLQDVTVEELLSCSVTFKEIVDIDRLIGFTGNERTRSLMADEFRTLDELLYLRMREYSIGLRGDGQAVGEQMPASGIPAANRYVAITDNQQAQIISDLAALKDAIRGANDVSGDDRELALYEIAVFEATIAAPRVATDLVQRFVDRVVKWIAALFAAAVVAEVAQRLVQALLPLLA